MPQKKPKKKVGAAGAGGIADNRSTSVARMDDLIDEGKPWRPADAVDGVVFAREVMTVWLKSDDEPITAVFNGIASPRDGVPHLVLHRNGRRIDVPMVDVEHFAQPGGRRVDL